MRDSCYVRVRVFPDSKKETLNKVGESRYEICVREPAERNLANRRVQYLLAVEYGVTEKAVRIVSGHHSPTKIFDIIT